MDPSAALREARGGARLTQRQLAARTGIAQPTIARIERGIADPLLETLSRLLAACGVSLAAVPSPGYGIDRSQLREMLRLQPAHRLELLRRDAEGLRRLEAARR